MHKYICLVCLRVVQRKDKNWVLLENVKDDAKRKRLFTNFAESPALSSDDYVCLCDVHRHNPDSFQTTFREQVLFFLPFFLAFLPA
jgi:hypothetical protein